VAAGAVVDRREHAGGRIFVHQPDTTPGRRVAAKAHPVAFRLDRHPERRHPVAVAAVDRLLRRPQDRQRLPAFGNRIELRSHQAAQDPASPVRGQDADERDPGGNGLPTRNREDQRDVGGGADEGVAVVRREHPLAVEDSLVARGILVVESLLKGRGAGLEEASNLLRGRGADLDRHEERA
jgi:hypothetical protein